MAIDFNKRTYSEQQFRDAYMGSQSIAEVCRKLNLAPFGGSYESIHKAVRELDLPTDHILGRELQRGVSRGNGKVRVKDDEIFVENSSASRATARNRIIRDNLIPYYCSICGLKDWQGLPISFALDHINGIGNDHRLENLRFLCPNCHSQTETFAGKNTKNHKSVRVPKEDQLARRRELASRPIKKCFSETCENLIPERNKWCLECRPSILPSPDRKEFLSLLHECDWNFQKAADKLNLTYYYVKRFMSDFDITTKDRHLCVVCGGPTSSGALTNTCLTCTKAARAEKAYHNIQEVFEVFEQSGRNFSKTAKHFGLTDNAIKKRLLKAGLIEPKPSTRKRAVSE